MSKKTSCAMLLLIACFIISTPVFAKAKNDGSYFINIPVFPLSATFDIRDLKKGSVRLGWGERLLVCLLESDECTSDEGAESFTRITQVSWNAILPNGNVEKPQSVASDGTASFLIPFEITGVMKVRASIDGVNVAELNVSIVGTDMMGYPISGWKKRLMDMYYIDDNGLLDRGWNRIDGKWYFFDKEGVLQTGWNTLSWNGKTSWYYFDADSNIGELGRMLTGWQRIDGIWYYFHKDGSMASNEWVGGYWLSENGAWKYQPKGKWRKNSKGWWFEDERGWYPKGEKVTINGVEYTFAADGYLAE